MKFEELKVDPRILHALNDMKFETATEIQEQSIPLLLQGEDVIGQAKTGTGKTAAFGIFMLEQLAAKQKQNQHVPRPYKPYALVLAPTRELAVQIKEEITKIGKYMNLSIVAVYGGAGLEPQVAAMRRGVHIVVGTPGRLLDHIERRTIDLSGVNIVVLDEADRMLDMGFVEDVEKILKLTQHNRQTMLFSATMSPEIREISRRYMKDPASVNVSQDELVVEKIEQYFVEVTRMNKLGTLLSALKKETPALALVFVRTKLGADRLNHILHDRGFDAMTLHGNMSQNQRDRAMEMFRKGHVKVLVATDLASRGLDVKGITHVFNYDLPEEPEVYVHRIGRTGRMEANGKAISFLFPDQREMLRLIEHKAHTRLKRIEFDPTDVPAMQHRSHPDDRQEGGSRFGRERRGFGNRREGGFGNRHGGDRGRGGRSGGYGGGHRGGDEGQRRGFTGGFGHSRPNDSSGHVGNLHQQRDRVTHHDDRKPGKRTQYTLRDREE